MWTAFLFSVYDVVKHSNYRILNSMIGWIGLSCQQISCLKTWPVSRLYI